VTGRRTVAGLVLATVLALGVAMAGAGPATAQAAPSPSFVLAGQSPWTAPGGLFLLRLQAGNVPPGASVALTVHDALDSRTAFDESVSGGSLPATRERTAVPFDTLRTDAATGDRLLLLPTTQLAGGGVYPLEVDLRSAADESIARFVTHVVVPDLAADGTLAVGQRLHVAWVWPLRAEPAYVAGGFPINPTTLATLQPGGRLGRQARQLAANPDVPLTLAPSPETLDAWGALGAKLPAVGSGASLLQLSASRDQVLAGPFVPLDLPAVIGSGLSGVVNPELARGITTLESFFGTHIDPSTALPGQLDTASLRMLQNASARQLVVRGDALTPVVEDYTPAHPYKMQAVAGDDSTAVTVVATDPGLEKFLSGDDPPALRAAHLLAGLALVAGEQPSLPRGVAIANPNSWDANDTFVTAVLAGLRRNPLLQPDTVAGLLAAVPTATVDNATDGAPVYRQLAPYSAPAAPVTLAEYQQGEHDRAAVANLVRPDDARIASADRALATSVSADWQNRDGRIRARDLLAGIGASANGLLAQIKVQSRGTITITSSKAEIPIGFKNTSDQDITVHLKLESDRLLFPDGSERDVLLPAHRSTTVRVAVETRGSGTAPVLMTVTTTDGLAIPHGVTTIKVRSSFVSGVGIFLTVGAIVFLAIWWGWDIRRRRKRKGDTPVRARALAMPTGQPA
jgi:Family of unknown function (DUF6049)